MEIHRLPFFSMSASVKGGQGRRRKLHDYEEVVFGMRHVFVASFWLEILSNVTQLLSVAAYALVMGQTTYGGRRGYIILMVYTVVRIVTASHAL